MPVPPRAIESCGVEVTTPELVVKTPSARPEKVTVPEAVKLAIPERLPAVPASDKVSKVLVPSEIKNELPLPMVVVKSAPTVAPPAA